MTILKNLALGLLSFLLFLSLSLFGIAFMIKNTLLNPDFVSSELDRLDVSSLVEELIVIQTYEEEPVEEFQAALFKTVAKLEPVVKEEVGVSIYLIYDYLLGKEENLHLTQILKNTLLSRDFITSLLAELDMSDLASELIKAELTTQIPPDLHYLVDYLDESLDEAIGELEPLIEAEIIAAADPLADYLLGEIQNLNVDISLVTLKENLRDTLWDTIRKSPPPALAMFPEAALKVLFDELYPILSAEIPSTFKLNESLIPAEVPAGIAEGISQAEEVLTEARFYINYFQMIYWALIGFMVLLILGIILISREVKYITRSLGTTFLVYGVFEYGGIFLAKHLTRTLLPQPEIPQALLVWLPTFYDHLLAPLEMFSLGMLAGGIVLLVASFVYPRLRSA